MHCNDFNMLWRLWTLWGTSITNDNLNFKVVFLSTTTFLKVVIQLFCIAMCRWYCCTVFSCCTSVLQVIVLYGNLAVLGLLILQKHTRRPKSTDYSIFRYIQVYSYISRVIFIFINAYSDVYRCAPSQLLSWTVINCNLSLVMKCTWLRAYDSLQCSYVCPGSCEVPVGRAQLRGGEGGGGAGGVHTLHRALERAHRPMVPRHAGSKYCVGIIQLYFR